MKPEFFSFIYSLAHSYFLFIESCKWGRASLVSFAIKIKAEHSKLMTSTYNVCVVLGKSLGCEYVEMWGCQTSFLINDCTRQTEGTCFHGSLKTTKKLKPLLIQNYLNRWQVVIFLWLFCERAHLISNFTSCFPPNDCFFSSSKQAPIYPLKSEFSLKGIPWLQSYLLSTNHKAFKQLCLSFTHSQPHPLSCKDLAFSVIYHAAIGMP